MLAVLFWSSVSKRCICTLVLQSLLIWHLDAGIFLNLFVPSQRQHLDTTFPLPLRYLLCSFRPFGVQVRWLILPTPLAGLILWITFVDTLDILPFSSVLLTLSPVPFAWNPMPSVYWCMDIHSIGSSWSCAKTLGFMLSVFLINHADTVGLLGLIPVMVWSVLVQLGRNWHTFGLSRTQLIAEFRLNFTSWTNTYRLTWTANEIISFLGNHHSDIKFLFFFMLPALGSGLCFCSKNTPPLERI